jgi:hypothetical protein
MTKEAEGIVQNKYELFWILWVHSLKPFLAEQIQNKVFVSVLIILACFLNSFEMVS